MKKVYTQQKRVPACPRCADLAAWKHDAKGRWWCKGCSKAFTPGITANPLLACGGGQTAHKGNAAGYKKEPRKKDTMKRPRKPKKGTTLAGYEVDMDEAGDEGVEGGVKGELKREENEEMEVDEGDNEGKKLSKAISARRLSKSHTSPSSSTSSFTYSSPSDPTQGVVRRLGLRKSTSTIERLKQMLASDDDFSSEGEKPASTETSPTALIKQEKFYGSAGREGKRKVKRKFSFDDDDEDVVPTVGKHGEGRVKKVVSACPHSEKPYYAKGKCRACYWAEWKRINCAEKKPRATVASDIAEISTDGSPGIKKKKLKGSVSSSSDGFEHVLLSPEKKLVPLEQVQCIAFKLNKSSETEVIYALLSELRSFIVTGEILKSTHLMIVMKKLMQNPNPEISELSKTLFDEFAEILTELHKSPNRSAEFSTHDHSANAISGVTTNGIVHGTNQLLANGNHLLPNGIHSVPSGTHTSPHSHMSTSGTLISTNGLSLSSNGMQANSAGGFCNVQALNNPTNSQFFLGNGTICGNVTGNGNLLGNGNSNGNGNNGNGSGSGNGNGYCMDPFNPSITNTPSFGQDLNFSSTGYNYSTAKRSALSPHSLVQNHPLRTSTNGNAVLIQNQNGQIYNINNPSTSSSSSSTLQSLAPTLQTSPQTTALLPNIRQPTHVHSHAHTHGHHRNRRSILGNQSNILNNNLNNNINNSINNNVTGMATISPSNNIQYPHNNMLAPSIPYNPSFLASTTPYTISNFTGLGMVSTENGNIESINPLQNITNLLPVYPFGNFNNIPQLNLSLSNPTSTLANLQTLQLDSTAFSTGSIDNFNGLPVATNLNNPTSYINDLTTFGSLGFNNFPTNFATAINIIDNNSNTNNNNNNNNNDNNNSLVNQFNFANNITYAAPSLSPSISLSNALHHIHLQASQNYNANTSDNTNVDSNDTTSVATDDTQNYISNSPDNSSTYSNDIANTDSNTYSTDITNTSSNDYSNDITNDASYVTSPPTHPDPHDSLNSHHNRDANTNAQTITDHTIDPNDIDENNEDTEDNNNNNEDNMKNNEDDNDCNAYLNNSDNSNNDDEEIS